MTADEIRNQPITSHGAGLDDPQALAIGCAGILQELTAQLAEANALRRPRWVNLGTHTPFLVDASQVVGLGMSQIIGGGFPSTVLVYLRSASTPITITNLDHDEVRVLLGIDEDWMNPIARPPTAGRYMTEADYGNAMAIIDVARDTLTKFAMMDLPESLQSNFEKLNNLFESWESLPF